MGKKENCSDSSQGISLPMSEMLQPGRYVDYQNKAQNGRTHNAYLPGERHVAVLLQAVQFQVQKAGRTGDACISLQMTCPQGVQDKVIGHRPFWSRTQNRTCLCPWTVGPKN